jgi:hypothetical protein
LTPLIIATISSRIPAQSLPSHALSSRNHRRGEISCPDR